MTDWNSFYNLPKRTPLLGKCDVCGRKDGTVKAIIFVREYDPDAPHTVTTSSSEMRRCPLLCALCLEDEPTCEDLARKAIG
jgi:hypothetical protein